MDILAPAQRPVTGPPDGQPMVFAHGFGCDQNMWRFVAPAFEDDFRVVLFDHVGAGGSDPVGLRRRAAHARSTATRDDVLDICARSTCTTWSSSATRSRAMIGALAALAEPDRFAQLVLVGPSPRYIDDDGYVGGFSEDDIDELLDSLESNYLGWSSAMAPVIMGNPDRPELGEELTESFCRTDPEIARQLRAGRPSSPTTAPTSPASRRRRWCCSAATTRSPRSAVGEYVAAAIPDSALVILDATGHCPNLSAPEETTAAIDAFLRG